MGIVILNIKGGKMKRENSIMLTCTRCHRRVTFQANIGTKAAERAGWRIYNIGLLGTTLCPDCDARLMEFVGQAND